MQHTITIYQNASQVPAIALATPPQEVDATFLTTWLHGKSETTQRAYAADMRKFYAFVGLPLGELRLADFHAWIDSLAALKPASQARAIAAVKSALSFAVKTGYLQVNIGAVVKLPKLEDKLAERIMSEQSMAKLLALETHPRNHAILSLLYHAGLRAHELCNLQWRHVQERGKSSGQLAIFGKGKKTRFVLLDPDTWAELQKLKPLAASGDEYVFQSRQARSSRGDKATHRRMDESQIHRIVTRAAKRAGIEVYQGQKRTEGGVEIVTKSRVSPHWMRHAHATHSLENGAPISLVQDTLGHKSLETTAKYTHVRPNASSGQYLKV